MKNYETEIPLATKTAEATIINLLIFKYIQIMDFFIIWILVIIIYYQDNNNEFQPKFIVTSNFNDIDNLCKKEITAYFIKNFWL